MIKNVNCQHFKHGGFCDNVEVSKSLWGVGARVCSMYYNAENIQCKWLTPYPRPSAPPPPPEPKMPENETFREGDVVSLEQARLTVDQRVREALKDSEPLVPFPLEDPDWIDPDMLLDNHSHFMMPVTIKEGKMYMWYSICSIHQIHDANCGMCKAGSWHQIEHNHPEIPKGIYCYTIKEVKDGHIQTTVCPHWSKRVDKPEQENGYCDLLGWGDWEQEDHLSLLWDQCKECGINLDD